MKALILVIFILLAIPVCLSGQTRKYRIPFNSQKPDTGLLKRHFYFRSPEREQDRIAAETYPGSERFYARRPFLPHLPGKFNIRPDTTEKFYLIIKDPLLNRRVN